MKKIWSLFIIITLSFNVITAAFAEAQSNGDAIAEELVKVDKLYQSEKDFLTNDEFIVESSTLPSETLGVLKLSGEFQMSSEINDFPAYIVEQGSNVTFSYTDIIDYLKGNWDNHFCELLSANERKFNGIDLGSKIGKGAIIVLWSYDGENWNNAPVYCNTNLFADNNDPIENFYTATPNELKDGCFYKVYVLYRTKQLEKENNFLFLAMNEYSEIWSVEEYNLFLMADDSNLITDEANATIALDFEMNSEMEPDNTVTGVHVGNQSTVNRLPGEEDFTHNNGMGHAYAAEAGNMQNAQIKGALEGDIVEHKGLDTDTTGHIVKNGADYTITKKDGTVISIQTKYYNNASKSIAACFDDAGQFKYYDEFGNPMKIEVPADQYDRAVLSMRKRITNGQVGNITDPDEAINIVRKGSLTYQQAVNLAKAGTVESLKYDSINGCVSAGASFGISGLAQFAISMWETGGEIDASLKNAIYKGLEIGGNTFVISVAASQLSRTGLNSLLVPGSEAIVEALGPKAAHVFSQVGRAGAKPIYGAAAMKHAAKILRGNVVVGTITMIVFTVPDIADIVRGRISMTQFVKNAATTASGIGGGYAGATGGAAVGSLIFPGPGTVVGGIVGGVAGGVGASIGADYVADLIAPDDADLMLDIITEEFQDLANAYLLNNNEANQIAASLQEQIDANFVKEMVASEDAHEYIRSILEPMIESLVSGRQKISLPSDEDIAKGLKETMEEIYDEEFVEESNEG